MTNQFPRKKDSEKQEPIAELAKVMNDFFQERPVKGILQTIDEFFKAPFPSLPSFPVSLKSYDKEHHIVAELPGVKKDNIHIDVFNQTLTISVHNDETIIEEDEQKKTYSKRQNFHQMSRSITLPQPINEKKVKASYHDGLLTIIVPKQPGKRIHIIND